MAGNKHSGNLKEIKHLTDQKQNQVTVCSIFPLDFHNTIEALGERKNNVIIEVKD
jgi:hypothetical protein